MRVFNFQETEFRQCRFLVTLLSWFSPLFVLSMERCIVKSDGVDVKRRNGIDGNKILISSLFSGN